MWVTLIYKPGVVVPVVIGPFRDEITADAWAERVRDGYEDLDARVEWAYSPATRSSLKEALADLEAQEASVFSLPWMDVAG